MSYVISCNKLTMNDKHRAKSTKVNTAFITTAFQAIITLVFRIALLAMEIKTNACLFQLLTIIQHASCLMTISKISSRQIGLSPTM